MQQRLASAVWAILFGIAHYGATNTRTASVPRESSDAGASRILLGHETGLASWYSDHLAGRHTASGEPYDPHRYTAAHRTLPLGTRLRVTRTDTGRSVEVVVNDRGPFASERRIVDLSRAAAAELGIVTMGIAPVRLAVVEIGHAHYHRR